MIAQQTCALQPPLIPSMSIPKHYFWPSLPTLNASVLSGDSVAATWLCLQINSSWTLILSEVLCLGVHMVWTVRAIKV